MTELRKVIAIDFDGCLCKNEWPEIGEPYKDVFAAAIAEQKKGTAIILNTCRFGELLLQAVAFCAENGLVFDAVNENLQERIEAYGGDCRKISADEYWDDRAVQFFRGKSVSERIGMLIEKVKELEKKYQEQGFDHVGYRTEHVIEILERTKNEMDTFGNGGVKADEE